MKPGTLFCLVLVKWFELIFLTLITAFIFAGTYQLHQRTNGEAVYLEVLSVISAVLAGYNWFFNNLMTNLRFKFKQDCYTCGHLIFDIPNALMCSMCCKWICQDKFHWKNPQTFAKWMFTFVWFVIVIGLIKDFRYKNQELYEFDPQSDEVNCHLDDLMIVYLFQHLIFVACRPFFLCCFVSCTLCLDHGEKYALDEDFSFSIISFDYIRHMKKKTEHIEERPVGFEEISMHQEKDRLRSFALAETNRALKYDKLNPQNIRVDMREGLKDLTGFNDCNRQCAVCTMPIEIDEEIVRIGGDKNIIVKASCFEALKKYGDKNEQKLGWPICDEIDEDDCKKDVVEMPAEGSLMQLFQEKKQVKTIEKEEDVDAPPENMKDTSRLAAVANQNSQSIDPNPNNISELQMVEVGQEVTTDATKM